MQREEPPHSNVNTVNTHQVALISQETDQKYRKKGPCFYCKKDGHIKSECRRLKGHVKTGKYRARKTRLHEERSEHRITGPGRRTEVDFDSQTSSTEQKEPHILKMKGSGENPLTIDVSTYGKKVNAMIDTGSTITVIHPKKFYEIHRHTRPKLSPNNSQSRMANSEIVISEGQTTRQIDINGEVKEQRVIVADDFGFGFPQKT